MDTTTPHEHPPTSPRLLPPPGPPPLDELTAAEFRVLGLIADARTNTAIAQELCLSHRTVECHVSRILLKLGLLEGHSCHRRVAAALIYHTWHGAARALPRAA